MNKIKGLELTFGIRSKWTDFLSYRELMLDKISKVTRQPVNNVIEKTKGYDLDSVYRMVCLTGKLPD